MNQKQLSGKEGEKLALEYLKGKGFSPLGSHYWTRYGELDLIMEDEGTVVFVEVKRRNSDTYGEPEEAVTPFKRNHLARAALMYIKERNLFEKAIRFDVVSVGPEGIKHFTDALEFQTDFYY